MLFAAYNMILFSLWRVHKRIAKGIESLEIFGTQQWTFDNTNVVQIRSKMNELELSKYRVSSEGIDIEKYIEDCLLGGHKYLLKDGSKFEDFEKGRRLMSIVSDYD